MRTDSKFFSRVMGGVLAIALLTLLGGAPASDPGSPADLLPIEGICDLKHPIETRVVALDTIERGQSLNLAIDVRPQFRLDNAAVELVALDGVAIAGAKRAEVGTMLPEQTATRRFAITVPAEGHRFLLTYRVVGEGPHGMTSRMGTFNILPDGPADPGRRVTTTDGREVLEYSARRIDR